MTATLQPRREFLIRTSSLFGVALLPSVNKSVASDQSSFTSMPFGRGEFYSFNDGQLQLPGNFELPDSLSENEKNALLLKLKVTNNRYTPDCNVVLWKSPDRTVLFDTGSGSQFAVGGGDLTSRLEQAGIDPYDITDVVFTHAHPDHLWGVLDDFDDIAFPEAQFHIAQKEWDYWLDSKTLDRTVDSRKSFVVGAQNRLPLLREQLSLFNDGDEIISGLEAVATHGHTPGHTSYVLHSGTESLMVVGDAIANAVLSFEFPSWPSESDQDKALGSATRLSLLDRLSQDKSLLVGYHLPAPGIGHVERDGRSYQFIANGG